MAKEGDFSSKERGDATNGTGKGQGRGRKAALSPEQTQRLAPTRSHLNTGWAQIYRFSLSGFSQDSTVLGYSLFVCFSRELKKSKQTQS